MPKFSNVMRNCEECAGILSIGLSEMIFLATFLSQDRGVHVDGPKLTRLGVTPSFTLPYDSTFKWESKQKDWPYRELNGDAGSSWTQKKVAHLTFYQWSWSRAGKFKLTGGKLVRLETGQVGHLTREASALWLAVRIGPGDSALCVRCEEIGLKPPGATYETVLKSLRLVP